MLGEFAVGVAPLLKKRGWLVENSEAQPFTEITDKMKPVCNGEEKLLTFNKKNYVLFILPFKKQLSL